MSVTYYVDSEGNKVELKLGENSLDKSRQEGRTRAIQFACGLCCKRAVGFNVFLVTIDVSDNEVRIEAENFEILTYSWGKLVNKQTSTTDVTIRPISRVCTIENDIVELNPNDPLNIGVSPFAVEVDCEGCCKKVLNVNSRPDMTQSFPILTPPENQLLYILTFSCGNLISVQSAPSVLVNRERICNIERNVTEVPIPKPPQPTTRGVSFFKK